MAAPETFARAGGPPGGGGQARSARIPGSAGEASKRAAAQRVSRYWNPRTSRMEVKGPGGHLLANEQGQHHPVPPGHQISHTQTTTHREAPAGRGKPKPEFSLLTATPAQLKARAEEIVNANRTALRQPFQAEQNLLGQEQTYGLNRNTEQFGKLGQTIESQQNTQAGTAKTFENYAADQVNKATTATPGLAETQERLGIPAGGKLPEAVQRQQEAARTLLTGITSASAAGTTARQQAESNFLTNMRANVPLQQAETGRNIEAQFGKQKAQVAGREGTALTRAAGELPSLLTKLEGEQSKIRTAALAGNVKLGDLIVKQGTLAANKEYKAGQLQLGKGKLAQGAQKLGIDLMNANTNQLKAVNDATYKKANLAEKRRVDSAKINDLTNKIKVAYARIAAKGAGGPKVSSASKAKGENELGIALNAFATGPKAGKGLKGKPEGRNYGAIRTQLATGNYRTTEVGGKERGYKGPQATNPVILNAAEQIYRYHYINSSTKAALKNMGLPYEGLSNLLASLYK